ncbi:NAD-dependent deacylase [Algirhabdus cladophorae]|uniref:NAD-dependent deacylase n=1 Tax=Algirhabdus cladophorae TaxID=3377108 RepID=UPI003B846EE7
MSKIVILTGAGISAESGLGTFRAEDGLWAEHRVEDVATPEGFARNPELVMTFYNDRRAQSYEASPNAAHVALAALQQADGFDVVIVTQNVDDLHERGGADAIHMHGGLTTALCHHCGHRWPAPLVMDLADTCPSCGQTSTRPDIVWFGEMPYQMDRIERHLSECDLFVSIGTSGNVYPAAGFVQMAKMSGAEALELNLEPSQGASYFDKAINGPASQIVPEWVRSLIG